MVILLSCRRCGSMGIKACRGCEAFRRTGSGSVEAFEKKLRCLLTHLIRGLIDAGDAGTADAGPFFISEGTQANIRSDGLIQVRQDLDAGPEHIVVIRDDAQAPVRINSRQIFKSCSNGGIIRSVQDQDFSCESRIS